VTAIAAAQICSPLAAQIPSQAISPEVPMVEAASGAAWAGAALRRPTPTSSTNPNAVSRNKAA